MGVYILRRFDYVIIIDLLTVDMLTADIQLRSSETSDQLWCGGFAFFPLPEIGLYFSHNAATKKSGQLQ